MSPTEGLIGSFIHPRDEIRSGIREVRPRSMSILLNVRPDALYNNDHFVARFLLLETAIMNRVNGILTDNPSLDREIVVGQVTSATLEYLAHGVVKELLPGDYLNPIALNYGVDSKRDAARRQLVTNARILINDVRVSSGSSNYYPPDYDGELSVSSYLLSQLEIQEERDATFNLYKGLCTSLEGVVLDEARAQKIGDKNRMNIAMVPEFYLA